MQVSDEVMITVEADRTNLKGLTSNPQLLSMGFQILMFFFGGLGRYQTCRGSD